MATVDFSLANKVAIITGESKGIARNIWISADPEERREA